MGYKIFFTLSLLALFFLNYFFIKQIERKNSNLFLFANPLALKFFSGISHNILADKLCLLRSSISETAYNNSYSVNKQKFIKASQTIAILNPFFYEANNYAITYLATVAKDLNSSLDILRMTRFFDKDNFKLYFLDSLLLVTYAKKYGLKIDFNYIELLRQKMLIISKNKKVLLPPYAIQWINYLKKFSQKSEN